MQKIQSVNSTLVQVRHVYACGEGCVTKFFMSKCSQGNFIGWDKVSCKTIKGFQSYLKKPPGGKVYTSSPPKKKQFSCTLNSCSCTHGCFMPLILYLIQNIFQELIISYLTGNKSLEINFPEIALNNTLMTTNSCKSTTIQQNVIVNLLLFTVITLMTSNLRLTKLHCCICRH